MPCDYKKYPKNWKEIRARILERAGNMCELCFVPNHTKIIRDSYGQWLFWELQPRIDILKPIKVVLTIAHINQDINDNRRSNLLACCQRCHNRIDLPYRLKNRKRK